MANNFLQPITPFLPSPGSPTILWKQWKGQFEIYMLASDAMQMAAERRRAILLHSLGAEGQRIFQALPTLEAAEGEDSFHLTMRMLDSHFLPKINVVARRHEFRQREQLADETIDVYVAALRELAVTCDFGE